MMAPDTDALPMPEGDDNGVAEKSPSIRDDADASLTETAPHHAAHVESRFDQRRVEMLPEISGYKLLEELGRGGMGVVLKARQLSPERLVAIKMIRDALATHEDEVRFRNEVEAIAQLRHRNIVQVYDYAIADGHPYFSMELLDGGPLSNRIGEQWAAKDAALLVEKLARALHHAHEQGIVHRDIKPDNILFSQDGEPQLTDFGLARREDCDYLKTVSGTQMGTPPYMSPEQARGDTRLVDARSDVWSLGAVLYEMLTGRRAFPGNNRAQVLQRVQHVDPVSPRRICRRLDKDLATICMKCLSKDVDSRYRSALAVADDLRAYLELRPIKARPASGILRARKWVRRRPLAAASVAAMLMCIVAGVYGLWFYDAYRATHVRYYGNLSFRWGLPVGVHELSAADVHQRRYSFEITKTGRRNPPTIVRVVDASGDPVDGLMRTWFEGVLAYDAGVHWSQTNYTDNSFGQLIEERAFNSAGIQVYTMNYRYSDRYQSDPMPLEATATYSRPDGADLDSALIKFFRRPHDGLDTQVHFYSRNATPMANAEGVYGFQIEYGEHGLPSAYICLGSDHAPENPMVCNFGFAIARFARGSQGDLKHIEFLDPGGEPVRSSFGHAVESIMDDGNIRRRRFYDVDGETLVFNKIEQCYGFDLHRDESGRFIDIAYVDKSGEPYPKASQRSSSE